MAERVVSQRSIVAITRVFNLFLNRTLNYGEILYEHDFPDWFIVQATQRHDWNWVSLLIDSRRGTFFFVRDNIGGTRCIVPLNIPIHTDRDAAVFGEYFIQKLAAFATTLPSGEELVRSLQLDGFDVDKVKWKLVPLEGAVSAEQEEDHLTKLVKASGVPATDVVLKHIEDASSLFAEGKDHPSLNESRSLIQALIDGISTETNTHGKHSRKLPGPMKDRIEYLTKVGFFVPDEEASLKAGWAVFQPDHILVCPTVS
ncbi:MAG TPA: hypothetical protein VK812_07535 [Candidatus Binatus sp.]|nr:hypothetical protein [Candidatus Binatus sp.]